MRLGNKQFFPIILIISFLIVVFIILSYNKGYFSILSQGLISECSGFQNNCGLMFDDNTNSYAYLKWNTKYGYESPEGIVLFKKNITLHNIKFVMKQDYDTTHYWFWIRKNNEWVLKSEGYKLPNELIINETNINGLKFKFKSDKWNFIIKEIFYELKLNYSSDEPIYGMPCDDGNPCTINDVWVNNKCVGEPMDCDDSNSFTNDYCVNGECVHEAIIRPPQEGLGEIPSPTGFESLLIKIRDWIVQLFQ